MSKRPLVSILIPVYQGQNYIKSTIESIIQQTFQDFELIIVDNNSTDLTESIVRSFDDDRILFFKNKTNIGAVNNWNLCLKLSSGKYIKLISHDDLIDDDCLRSQVEILEQDTRLQLSFVFSSRNIVDERSNLIFTKRYPFRSSGLIDKRRLKRDCIRYGTNLIGEPGAVLFRSAISQRVGGFDSRNLFVVDLDYWFRLLNYGNAYYQNEDLFSFRVLPESLGASFGFEQAKYFMLFVKQCRRDNIELSSNLDYVMSAFSSYFNMIARKFFYLFR